MFFALIWCLGLDVLLRYIYPVSHSTFHYSLNQKELFFRSPASAEELKVEVVKDHISSHCLGNGLTCWVDGIALRTHSHACSMALKADHQWLASAFMVCRLNLDALSNISVT
jgi:hypothetical protein